MPPSAARQYRSLPFICLFVAVGAIALPAVDEPVFSQTRGYVDEAFDLTLSLPNGGTIRYTTDGSTPAPENGTEVADSVVLRIDGTRVVRAMAVDESGSTRVVTHTYLFADQVISQGKNAMGVPDDPTDPALESWGSTAMNGKGYSKTELRAGLLSLPALVLVTDLDNFFDEEIGIFADLDRKTLQWEKPISLEYIDPSDPASHWQVDCGVQQAGASSSSGRKKPMELRFRGEYGSQTLEHRLFADAPTQAIDRIRLRVSGSGQAFDIFHQLAQQWLGELQAAMSVHAQEGTFVHVYINGAYWGVYNAIEVAGKHFASNHFGGEIEEWDNLRNEHVDDGVASDYHRVRALAELDQAENYQQAADWLDLPAFIDYRLAIALVNGDRDSSKEHRLVINHRRGLPLRFFPWDTDIAMSLTWPNNPERDFNLVVADSWADWQLLSGLWQNADFRLLFADRVERHLVGDGILALPQLQARLGQLWDRVDQAYQADFARWRGRWWDDADPPLDFDGTIARARDEWLPARHAALLSHLEDQGMLLPVAAPSLDRAPGEVETGVTVTISASSGTIVATTDGSDPRGADGEPGPTARVGDRTLDLIIDKTMRLRARRYNDGDWSSEVGGVYRTRPAGADLVVSELHYHPLPADTGVPGLLGYYCSKTNLVQPQLLDDLLETRIDQTLDFNWTGGAPLAAMTGNYGVTWQGSVIPAYDEQYTITVRSPSAIACYLPGAEVVTPLTKDGDDHHIVVDAVAGEPIRVGIDLRAASQPASIQLRWSSASQPDEVVPASALRTDWPHPNDGEFIELVNQASGPIDVSGMTFVDGIAYRFPPDSVIAAGERIVLVANPRFFAERHPGVVVFGSYAGSLSDEGERLSLVDTDGADVWSFTYGDSGAWPRAADGAGPSLNHRGGDRSDPGNWSASQEVGGSPGAPNNPAVDGVVRISEALTHSDPAVDWIELHNPSDDVIDVSGWYLTDDRQNPMAWQLPAGSSIAPNSYLVVDEGDFGSAFRLSSLGEEVVLFAADASGALTGYSHGHRFGAQFNGVSFGRHITSVGEEHFVRQRAPSPGTANVGVLVGPVVLSEICYNPSGSAMEFVEIVNISNTAVDLGPNGEGNPWRLEGTGFEFPVGAVLPAGAVALVVGGDPATFRSIHGIATSVAIYGPFPGKLDNGGETIALEQPDGVEVVDGMIVVPRVVIDQLDYDDEAPWPTSPDSAGDSLERIVLATYGDDLGNWRAAAPSPGIVPLQTSRRMVIETDPSSGIEARLPGGHWLMVPATFEGLAPQNDQPVEFRALLEND